MPLHPLTNFEIQKCYQNEPRFNVVCSRNNLPERNSIKRKDGAYIINLDDIGTHWIVLYVQHNDVFILIVLEWSIFPKKLEHLSVTKT